MSSLVTYGTNCKVFRFGDTEYKYRYRIPVIENRGATYNSGYIEGYQRALRDFQNSANKILENKRLSNSFYNY